MKNCTSSIALLALSVYCGALSAAETAEPPPQSTQAASAELQQEAVPTREDDQKNWIDSTHRYVSNSADDLANWIDHFFGSPRDDIESADSSLRLTWENEWEESEGQDTDVRLRGKVHLPRINERLSLIFTDEDGETTSETSEQLDELEGRPESTRVALQYKAREKKRYRIDYRLGLRSSLKTRASIRYRYQLPTSDKTTHRITETLYFIDGEGFGSRTRYEYDYLLKREHLLRWANSARYSEDTDGVEWSSRLILGKRRNDKSALSYFVWTSGETRPQYLTKAYGLGVKYRRNFHRPWLFYELEPAYAWKREPRDEDNPLEEYHNNREGIFLFSFRVEILLEQQKKK